MDLIFDSSGSPRSLIISASELSAREGMNLQKGMNYRDSGESLSVLLVLEREGIFTDLFDTTRGMYEYEGHDSVAEGAEGRRDDQLLMYASGKPTDNGKFYKAANAFKEGLRPEPLQVQIYEKLDPGVWFDKGIFNLIDATYRREERDGISRKVARFYLVPADAMLPVTERMLWNERMLPASVKTLVWARDRGRCSVCDEQSGLHFAAPRRGHTLEEVGAVALFCSTHLDSAAKL